MKTEHNNGERYRRNIFTKNPIRPGRFDELKDKGIAVSSQWRGQNVLAPCTWSVLYSLYSLVEHIKLKLSMKCEIEGQSAMIGPYLLKTGEILNRLNIAFIYGPSSLRFHSASCQFTAALLTTPCTCHFQALSREIGDSLLKNSGLDCWSVTIFQNLGEWHLLKGLQGPWHKGHNLFLSLGNRVLSQF